jgi:hypothetical protein
MEIGEPKEVHEIEPVDTPVPETVPVPMPTPTEAPTPEPVGTMGVQAQPTRRAPVQ